MVCTVDWAKLAMWTATLVRRFPVGFGYPANGGLINSHSVRGVDCGSGATACSWVMSLRFEAVLRHEIRRFVPNRATSSHNH